MNEHSRLWRKRLIERYRLILAQCDQMRADAEYWNRLHPDEKPIVVDLDFTDDVAAKMKALMLHP